MRLQLKQLKQLRLRPKLKLKLKRLKLKRLRLKLKRLRLRLKKLKPKHKLVYPLIFQGSRPIAVCTSSLIF